METLTSIAGLRDAVREARDSRKSVGFVPTMGALHEGHVSLIRAARQRCDFVVVSIFVNPTQFGPNEDFDRYPRTFEADSAACESTGADLIFAPQQEAIYPDGFAAEVRIGGVTEVLEGEKRPGHFNGVTTVVLKLFQIVLPDIAFFGQKDFQQQLVIRKMCRDLNVPVEINTCETVREADGLALSSRNRYLSDADRQRALALSKALFAARDELRSGATDLHTAESSMREQIGRDPGIEIDYCVLRNARTLKVPASTAEPLVLLGAIRIGQVRLIDNVLVDELR
ncbi:pantoate--beta-alanine ligase [Stratiformator vulcanicus]|uniref:Pantothenate synthetase n=1 Tax=Stratiformator vulcanicus TaxID=2527980 RepID=A0A517R3I1_9PLAN|nr:pantoate--beta-alanine ligase [Stratiformator vulcanicus]QDT38442.1 Pantoate-beta-alanine ligase [Stratiformator vulcanicus]